MRGFQAFLPIRWTVLLHDDLHPSLYQLVLLLVSVEWIKHRVIGTQKPAIPMEPLTLSLVDSEPEVCALCQTFLHDARAMSMLEFPHEHEGISRDWRQNLLPLANSRWNPSNSSTIPFEPSVFKLIKKKLSNLAKGPKRILWSNLFRALLLLF